MVSKEIKKYMFEKCPEIWNQYVNNEVSESYLMTGYELQKQLDETEKRNEELKEELFRQLDRREKLNRLYYLFHESVDMDTLGVKEKLFLN